MRCHLVNSGVAAEAEFSEANVEEIFLPLLRELTALRRTKGRRVLALLAAPPGAGKSTLAALLERLSEGEGLEKLTALGMDGFHYRQEYLRAHVVAIDGETVSLAAVKGAPQTFDLAGLRDKLRQAAMGKPCRWPAYDRTLHDPVENAVAVEGEILLVEGNYLLLDEPGWRELRNLADATISIAADPAFLRARLLARHVALGRPEAEAAAFVDRSDMANVRLCLSKTLPAGLQLLLLPDGSYAKLR